MFLRVTLFVLPAILAALLVSVAYGNPPGLTDLEQTDKRWDCEPYVPIAGNYQHCAPPGNRRSQSSWPERLRRASSSACSTSPPASSPASSR